MDRATHWVLVARRDCKPGQAKLNPSDFNKLSAKRSRVYLELKAQSDQSAIVCASQCDSVQQNTIEVDVGVLLSLHPARGDIENGVLSNRAGSAAAGQEVTVEVLPLVGITIPRPLKEVVFGYPPGMSLSDAENAVAQLGGDEKDVFPVVKGSLVAVIVQHQFLPKLMKVSSASPFPRGLVTPATQVRCEENRMMRMGEGVDSILRSLLPESIEYKQSSSSSSSNGKSSDGSHEMVLDDGSSSINSPSLATSHASPGFSAYLFESDDSLSEQGFVIVGTNNLAPEASNGADDRSLSSSSSAGPNSSAYLGASESSTAQPSDSSLRDIHVGRERSVVVENSPQAQSDFEFAQHLARALEEEEARHRRQLEEDEELARSLATALQDDGQSARSNRHVHWNDQVEHVLSSNSDSSDEQANEREAAPVQRQFGRLRNQFINHIRDALARRGEMQAERARDRRTSNSSRRQSSDSDDEDRGGLSQREINSLPLGQARKNETESCAICLASLNGSSEVRTLACLHQYHASCVDPWLESHSMCPICRTDALGR